MDEWNPVIAETYVRRVRFWRVLVAQAGLVLATVAAVWCVAVIVLSLSRGGL